MNKRIIAGIVAMLVFYLPELSFGSLAEAQENPHAKTTVQNQPDKTTVEVLEEAVSPGVVVIEGRPVLTVYESVGTLTPEQRASGIAARIVSFAASGGSPDSIRFQQHDAWTEIFIGNVLMMSVTDADARMAGKPRQHLPAVNAEDLRIFIDNYRRDHSWLFILRGLLNTGVSALVLVTVLWLIRRLRTVARGRVQNYIYTTARLDAKSTWHESVAYLGPIALAFGGIARWVL